MTVLPSISRDHDENTSTHPGISEPARRMAWSERCEEHPGFAPRKFPVFCPEAETARRRAPLIAKSRGFTLTIDAIKDYIEFMSLRTGQKTVSSIRREFRRFFQLFAVSTTCSSRQIHPEPGQAAVREGTDETYHTP